MQISTFKRELTEACLAFAWDQWGQIGVLATPHRHDRWAIDPEALILFSLEVARHDPRLFGEVLDWMLVNDRLVSVQRLRNLAADGDERTLVDAALAWVASARSGRSSNASEPIPPESALIPVFPGMHMRGATYDEAFRSHGFSKAATKPSGKSQPPDVGQPVNFAFRLRHLLGVSVRAEVMRCLLTIDAPRASTHVISRSAAYSKRNVQEALNSLRAARVISGITVGGDQGYAVERELWAPLFRFTTSGWPQQRDWPQLLGALVKSLRWLWDPQNEQLSDYLRASRVRDLLEEMAGDLLFAGVMVEHAVPGSGDGTWQAFVATVRNAGRAVGMDLRAET